MFGRLLVSFFATVAWMTLVSALVPPDPIITAAAVLPRQNAAEFVGWRKINGTWRSISCGDGLTLFQSGAYWNCCADTKTACPFAIACASGTQFYRSITLNGTFFETTSIACTKNYKDAKSSICNSKFLYENFQDSDPRTRIACGSESEAWSYYREVPATATETTDLNVSSTPSASVSSPSSTSTQRSEYKEESKAWIAGAVVGPVVGLALVTVALLFFLRRKNKIAQATQHGAAAMAPHDPFQPPVGVGGHTDSKPQLSFEKQAFFGQPSPRQNAVDSYAQQGFSPQHQAYGNDSKYGYAAPPHYGLVEMGSEATGDAQTAPPILRAELAGGETRRGGESLYGGAELATTYMHERKIVQ